MVKSFSSSKLGNFFSSLKNSMQARRAYCFLPFNKDFIVILNLFYKKGLIKKFVYNETDKNHIKVYFQYNAYNQPLLSSFQKYRNYRLKKKNDRFFYLNDYFLVSTNHGLKLIGGFNLFDNFSGDILYGIKLQNTFN